MYWFYRALAQILWWLRPRGIEILASLLGGVWYYLLPFRKDVIFGNLRRAFPEMGDRARRQQGRRAMDAMMEQGLELLSFVAAPPGAILERCEVEGLHHFEEAMAGGGLIGLACHVDSTDVIVQTFGALGYPQHTAARLPKNKAVRRLLEDLRVRSQTSLYEPRGSMEKLTDALLAGGAVAVVADQAQSRRRGVFVHFFGTPASTTPGLALLHERTGRPVLPFIPIYLGGGRRRVQVGPPIPLDDIRDDPDFVRKATARFTALVEAHVRRQPDRWLWAHRRFKVQPEPGDVVADPVALTLNDDGSITLLESVARPANESGTGTAG